MPVETDKPDSPQVLRTKAQLKSAFLQLRKKKSIAQINIHEITALAQINRTSFYRYYFDVYDLQQDVLNDFIAQFQQILSAIFQKLLTQGNISMQEMPLQFLLEHQDILQILLHDPDSIAHLKQEQKIFVKQFLQIPHDDARADYALEFLISGQLGIISYWLQHQDTLSLENLFALIKEMLLSQGPLAILLQLAPESLRENLRANG